MVRIGSPYPNVRLEEGHVECQPKGNDQESRQKDHLAEGVEDVDEHNDVDTSEGELPDEDDQVNPGKKDGDGSDLPLPLAWAQAVLVEDPGKYD